MSNIKNKPVHLNGINAVVHDLAESGWTFEEPIYTSDRNAYLCKGIPPIGESKLRLIYVGATKDKFYAIAIGDKWNIIGGSSDKNEDVAIETLKLLISSAKSGVSKELSPEINELLAAME